LLLQFLPLLHFLQMVPGDTSPDRADNGVMAGVMAGDPAGDRAGKTADRMGRRRRQQAGGGDGDECGFDFHVTSFFKTNAAQLKRARRAFGSRPVS
jgi:hypothetical protein